MVKSGFDETATKAQRQLVAGNLANEISGRKLCRHFLPRQLT